MAFGRGQAVTLGITDSISEEIKLPQRQLGPISVPWSVLHSCQPWSIKTKVKGEKNEKNSLGNLVYHRLHRSYRNRICKIEEGVAN
jgi:hypothetical protein